MQNCLLAAEQKRPNCAYNDIKSVALNKRKSYQWHQKRIQSEGGNTMEKIKLATMILSTLSAVLIASKAIASFI